MPNKIYVNARYGFREDSLENWQANNPVLERGEPSIVRDGVDGDWLKIGDGETPWNDLPYKRGPAGPKGDGVGRETEYGGEIFNDFDNNTAGLMGFNIKTVSQVGKTVTFTLDSVEGIEVGDVVSAQTNTNYDCIGSVTEIADLQITVQLYDDGLTIGGITGTLWIPAKAYIGTKSLGEYGFAANLNNKASAKAAAAFGESNIAGGKRAFVAGGEENFAGYCCFVAGQKVKVRAVRSAGFGYNNDIAPTAQYGLITGSGNILRSKGALVAGINNSEGYGSAMGGNFIAGIENTIENDSWGGLILSGYGNTIKNGSSRLLVTGSENIVSGGQHIVGGAKNKVTGADNIVGGEYNDVSGKYNNVSGHYNVVPANTEACIVSGYANTLGERGKWHIVTGSNNKIGGEGWCFVQGRDNTVGASTNFVFGEYNTVSNENTGSAQNKQNNFVKGHSNYIEGGGNFINGSNNKVGGKGDGSISCCLLQGNFLVALADDQTVLGRANVGDADAQLIIGIGTYDGDRKNGFVVKKDGSARVFKESTENDAVVRYSQLKKLMDEFNAYKTEAENRMQALENKISALESGVR